MSKRTSQRYDGQNGEAEDPLSAEEWVRRGRVIGDQKKGGIPSWRRNSEIDTTKCSARDSQVS